MLNITKLIKWYKIRKLEKRIIKINRKINKLYNEKKDNLLKINELISS
jgi:hypothetical protein